MIRGAINQLAKPIGFDIGSSDDHVQSDLLNGFCDGLSSTMNDRDLDMQSAYIVDKLDDKSIKVIKKLHSFIELKEQESS